MGQPDVSVVVLGALNVFGIGMIDVFVIFCISGPYNWYFHCQEPIDFVYSSSESTLKREVHFRILYAKKYAGLKKYVSARND